jgi:hypothetical protein
LHRITLTVEVPNNRDDVLPLFLALLCRSKCELTLATLHLLLRVAMFDDCPLLCDLMRYFMRFAIPDEPLKDGSHGSQQENE